jgi:hypothetical protein
MKVNEKVVPVTGRGEQAVNVVWKYNARNFRPTKLASL